MERKSLPDLLGSITKGRDRLRREMQLPRSFPYRVVVVEASYQDLLAGNYRSAMTPQAAAATVASWSGRYCPFYFLGDRTGAERWTQDFLVQVALGRLRELEALRRAMHLA